jgi:propionyl-CoA carboxylase alpha chain
LLAPLPGSVVQVAVVSGQRVVAGDVLVVLEAMKMEHTVRAPFDGTVTEVRVELGEQVESGAVLVVVEPGENATA